MTTLHIIPNAHLDPVWLWDAREGLDQGIRTIRSVLDLMDEFPELTFVRGEAAIYRHVEETAPELMERIRKRIKEGRWDVVGGTWIQPDTNLAGAFTLRRQFETGLAYFTSRLGVRPRVAWQADAFGHTAGLPDILAEAGMESFAFWRPQQNLLSLPKPAFRWRGPSGASILCYRLEPGWYGTNRDEAPRRLDGALETAGRAGLDNVAVFLGLGDHGGGPSRRQILDVRAWAAAHPEVRVEWSGLHRFFDALRAEAAAKGGDTYFPEVSGELNFTLRGCYTSCLRVKTAFRHAEAELATAETAVDLTGKCSQFTNVHKSSLNTRCDQTLSERKGRNRAGRCVIERRCAAMTQSARFFCRPKSSGLKMAACGIAANGGVRCHSRYFPCDLCVPLHGQALVTPLNTNGTNGNINDKGGASRPGEPEKLTFPIDANENLGFVNNCGQLSQLSIVNNSIPSLSAASESLLFNSFHDILPGSCMERAVEEQLQQLGGVRDAARKALHAALRAIATAADTSVPKSRGDFPAALPFVVFNPHPWEYRGPLELEGCIDDRPDYFKPYGSGQAPLVVRDPRGRRIPFQIVPAEAQFGDVVWRSRVVIDARIPARGFAIYTLGWDVGGSVRKSSLNTNGTNINANVANVQVLPIPVSNVANTWQNWKLNLDTGNISTMATLPNASAFSRGISNGHFAISARIGAVGIRILRDGKPWLKGAGLQALLFRDPYGSWGTNEPRQYDESVPSVAWRVERAEVVESGPMRSALWVRLADERSWLELVLRLAACRDVIDCDARLLWNERAARLKLSLPCGAAAADCAVPGAVVRRTAALGEVPFVPWARTVDRSGSPVLGFASDALCGLDMARGALRPSVVRASGYAWAPRDGAPMEPWRPATDLGEHRFRFLLAPGTADLPRLAAELLQPPATALAHVSSPGPLGRSGTLVCRENGWRKTVDMMASHDV